MDDKSKRFMLGAVVLVVGYKMTMKSIDRSIGKIFKQDETPGVVVDEGEFWDDGSWEIENNSGVFTAWIKNSHTKGRLRVILYVGGSPVKLESLASAHMLISKIDSGDIIVIWDVISDTVTFPRINASDVASL